MPDRMPVDRAALLGELADQLDAMVAYWDADQTCVYANAAYHAWFARHGRKLIGITLCIRAKRRSTSRRGSWRRHTNRF
jgi:hypothetical protein